jgi:hypothetical protein
LCFNETLDRSVQEGAAGADDNWSWGLVGDGKQTAGGPEEGPMLLMPAPIQREEARDEEAEEGA